MEHVTLDSAVRQAEDVLYRNLDGEAVLVNLGSGACFELDRIGTEVWELIGRGTSLGEILKNLLAVYGVEEAVAEGELLGLINELVANGLVHAQPEGATKF